MPEHHGAPGLLKEKSSSHRLCCPQMKASPQIGSGQQAIDIFGQDVIINLFSWGPKIYFQRWWETRLKCSYRQSNQGYLHCTWGCLSPVDGNLGYSSNGISQKWDARNYPMWAQFWKFRASPYITKVKICLGMSEGMERHVGPCGGGLCYG